MNEEMGTLTFVSRLLRVEILITSWLFHLSPLKHFFVFAVPFRNKSPTFCTPFFIVFPRLNWMVYESSKNWICNCLLSIYFLDLVQAILFHKYSPPSQTCQTPRTSLPSLQTRGKTWWGLQMFLCPQLLQSQSINSTMWLCDIMLLLILLLLLLVVLLLL